MELKEFWQSLFNLSNSEMIRLESETSELDVFAHSKGWSEDDLLEIKVQAYVEARNEHQNRN